MDLRTLPSIASVRHPCVIAEPEKTSCIVVQYVPLLCRGKEVRAFNTLDRCVDRVGPHHLIRSKHDPIAEARIDQPFEVGVKLCAGKRIVDHSGIDVNLSAPDNAARLVKLVIDECVDAGIGLREIRADPVIVHELTGSKSESGVFHRDVPISADNACLGRFDIYCKSANTG